jgi:hypothetical protein
MTRAAVDEVTAQIIASLPADGSPVLNRVMRVMLARRLKKIVDEETFSKARDILIERGTVGRLRGQGGQMFLTHQPLQMPTPTPLELTDGWSESRLMQPLRDYLEGPFRKNLDLPDGSACIVQDTSVMGGQKGKWARPDFILVSAMRFKIMPRAQIDLHSFELKTESGGSVLAIHEALAQTRFTHFGHFVWHLPERSKNEAMLEDIVTHCEEHGIGLIRLREPRKLDTWEILADPRRKPTLDSVVDGFLESRLNTDQKNALANAVRGAQ